jgi:hypothetical protein
MSKSYSQSELLIANVAAPALRELDLQITALDAAVVRMPYAAVAATQMQITAIDAAVVRMPYAAAATTRGMVRSVLAVDGSRA